jgi:hypothetical protein
VGFFLSLHQTFPKTCKKMKQFAVFMMLMIGLTAQAQSGLDKRQFAKYWQVESESPDYKVTFAGDTCEILSPKGLTLWRKEKMRLGMTVEYDACVVDEKKPGDRLSDMNCFWLASDSHAMGFFSRAQWRSGIFTRCYTLQMYYLGYGGNHNSTTRFRRYDGNEAGVEDASKRPAILKEYTDTAHLLKANHWYHIKIESTATGRTRYYIDGECIVDYLDPQPLKEGWFGFRTTLSRTRITNFKAYQTVSYSYATTGIPLHWVGEQSTESVPISFGIPFAQGELKEVSMLALSDDTPLDAWVNARWPDGSVKWAGLSAVVAQNDTPLVTLKKKKTQKNSLSIIVSDNENHITINTGKLVVCIPKHGKNLIDSLCIDGKRVGGVATLIASTDAAAFQSKVTKVDVERMGKVSAVIKAEGVHRSENGREWLPFTVRLYFYLGSDQMNLVHTFIYNGDAHRDQIRSIGLRFQVPMREATYNRYIAFATEKGIWTEPVQPLDGRRRLTFGNDKHRNLQAEQMEGKRIPDYEEFDEKNRSLLDHWAQWDGYRLSQLTDNAWSIRKRATSESPWIGTLTGTRSPGFAFVGDVSGGMGVCLKDFWQSYPSTIEVNKSRSSEAELTMWLWSPEAEAMNLCHYDTIAHNLLASYEDVQEGMSSPYGIARTSVLKLKAFNCYPGMDGIAKSASQLTADPHLLPTPDYLHEKRAFGIWSLPKDSSDQVEQRLETYIKAYQGHIEQYKWYGFWNYGDIMHTYDDERKEWRYDVGGFAWDNTELATPMWLWYNFLRTGRSDIWRMAEAMTRHCSEVDTYHIGQFAPLGSRHNVSHWGCGAKEARISQAAFNRFYYYLTTDERTGDLMSEQKDADTLLYHIDPMRLAEPRSQYPCQAPARLRIGPDWLAYAGNWMTEWERFGTIKYRDKIQTGLQSIAALPDGIFTGNLAKGYDPATGRISYDGDSSVKSTNHLMTIMGGFEVVNELMPMVRDDKFAATWLDFARRYKQMSHDIRHSEFPVRRLEAYAAWQDRDPQRTAATWDALWKHGDGTSNTNDAALWSLDAIYMQEVLIKRK